jgi:uncharacterized membrane protein
MSTTPEPLPAPEQTTSPNVIGGLAYLTIIPAIIFLATAPYNKDPFIRFHSWQSLIFGVGWLIVNIILGVIPILGWIVLAFFSVVALIIWVIAMIKAFQGEKWKIPFVGNFAEQQASKGGI